MSDVSDEPMAAQVDRHLASGGALASPTLR